MGFKIGDKVKLKSGGPIMTVSYVDGESIECTWFVNSDVKIQEFHSGTLDLVS